MSQAPGVILAKNRISSQTVSCWNILLSMQKLATQQHTALSPYSAPVTESNQNTITKEPDAFGIKSQYAQISKRDPPGLPPILQFLCDFPTKAKR